MDDFRSLVVQRRLAQSADICDLVDELVDHGVNAIPLLLSALGDSDARVREFAARGLGRLECGRASVVEALAVALGDDDVLVRQGAVVALNVLSPPAHNAAGALVWALHDLDPYVREYAAEALDMLSQALEPKVKRVPRRRTVSHFRRA